MTKTKRTHAFVVSVTLDEPVREIDARRQLREAVQELTGAFTTPVGEFTYPTKVTVVPIREG